MGKKRLTLLHCPRENHEKLKNIISKCIWTRYKNCLPLPHSNGWYILRKPLNSHLKQLKAQALIVEGSRILNISYIYIYPKNLDKNRIKKELHLADFMVNIWKWVLTCNSARQWKVNVHMEVKGKISTECSKSLLASKAQNFSTSRISLSAIPLT